MAVTTKEINFLDCNFANKLKFTEMAKRITSILEATQFSATCLRFYRATNCHVKGSDNPHSTDQMSVPREGLSSMNLVSKDKICLHSVLLHVCKATGRLITKDTPQLFKVCRRSSEWHTSKHAESFTYVCMYSDRIRITQ